MSHGDVGEEVGNPAFKAFQSPVGGGNGGLNGCPADGPAEEVGGHLGDAIQGDKLLGPQVDQPGAEAGAVLCGGVNAGREHGGHFAAGGGANLDLDLVFGHDEFLRGQIKDLSGVVADDGAAAERCSASAGTAGQAMGDNDVRVGGFRQGVPGVTGLPSGGATGFFTEAFGIGLGVAIGGRGLVAVVAVGGEALFEV